MKVFISHSWKNKIQAQKIADELKATGIDLWLDANNLLPGQLIQDTIDDVLTKIDVIVLVWSKEAGESGGVAAELFTCSRLKKIIIPCKMDSTSLSVHPYLSKIKGISFKDFNDGLGRLKMVLLNYMTRDFNMQDNESIRLMNEFMGTLETANHLIHKEDIKNKGSEEEKDFWVKKVQDTHDASYDKLKEEESIGKEVTAFLNIQMTELQSGLNNKNIVGKVLTEMKAYKYAGRPDMKKFIDQVESIYKSFENTDTDDAIVKYKKEMEEKLKSSEQQLKSSFGILADFLFTAAFENMRYFYLSSADHLEKLLQLSRQAGVHPLVADCANELLLYIKTPGGVIDNNQYGILGYADDAYFIQSILANLHQAGVVDTAAWNIDWVKANAGSEVVFNLVGNGIKEQLDNNINAYCQQLLQKYNPQAVQQQNLQQEEEKLQQMKDDVWKAKLMSLQTSMIFNPVY
jgi:TIR domain